MAEIRPLTDGLWVVEHPLKALGLELGRRMTVVRLGDGTLWLHSAALLTPELRSWLDDAGTISAVVSPNPMHHRFMEDYAAAWPGAALVASPGLPAKRPDLRFDRVLDDAPDPCWAADLDQAAVPFGPRFTEIVFLHRASRTLIVTDLFFHIPAGRGAWTSLVARALGYHRKPAVSWLLRAMARDRGALRDAIDRLLGWDFDRLILGHGDMFETGGKEALRRAFSWLEA